MLKKMPLWVHIAVGLFLGQIGIKLSQIIGMFLAG